MTGFVARAGTLALGLSLLMAGGAQAALVGPSGFTRAEIADFAREVQDALAHADTRRLARLSQWPLRVNVAQGKVRLLARSALRREFGRVFPPALIARVRAQDAHALFENADGVMFGDGELWAHGVCEDRACLRSRLLLFAVNPPSR
ncbi:hypothetical protein [Craterilacuibacter sp. RT1T]|uniref:hypothetical protein n=1 Tax=Craterilacuibacter sp. RT1T TaxID=2942211 RepID=UPI0020BED97F|nr:hypothetical protein [Craterilacuibacter sp. RT1T]MCL6262681.1 hypothetical protein [Craterilacuibacter sp. RT1T]